MSRAYRIRIQEQLRKVIRASDHVAACLELLAILPAEQMGELLASELKRRGFEPAGNRLTRRTQGICVEVEPGSGQVTVRAEAEEKVALEADGDAWLDEDWSQEAKEAATRQARQALQHELGGLADDKAAQLQREITDRLTGHLTDLKKELDQAVNRVTAEALKRRAAQLGQIKELTEDPESGSLTIVVEV
jgi:hypothetical protein